MHPNEQLARREIELINAGDDEALEQLYTDDFVFHYPGRNPLAGDYARFQDFTAKAQELFGDGTLKRALHDAFGSDDHAVQLVNVEAEVGGRTHSWRAVGILHVRDGRFSEAWLHVSDQYALDEFLNSLAD